MIDSGIRRASVWLLLLVAAVLSFPQRASAQGAAGIAEARDREGAAHYDARRYEEARVAFLQAHALDPKPQYLLHLAHAELRVGKAAEAANHLSQFLRENPDAAADDRQEAEIDLAGARARVTEVTVTVRPGATVYVDGEAIGKAPLAAPYFVTPGQRTFKAEYMGEAPEEQQMTAAPGGTLEVNFKGGASEEIAPPAAAPPPEDSAQVEFEATPAGRGKRVPILQWFTKTPAAWVGAGLTGVGLVLGTTFAITSSTYYSRANDIKAQLQSGVGAGACNGATGQVATLCKDFTDSKSTGDTQKTIAIVSFAVGGAALAGTIIYYFVDPKARVVEDTAVRVLPGSAGSVAGMTLLGTF